MAVDKQQLEQRIKQLSTEQAQTQQTLDALRLESEDYTKRFNEAQRKHDLEGNDRAGLDMTKYRNLRDDVQAKIQKMQIILSEFPARLTAIKLEIDHCNHRSDLQLLASLKEKEREALFEYEQVALALSDSHYNFLMAQNARKVIAEKATSFARSHQLPVPTSGDFNAPPIETWWAQPSMQGQLKRQFDDLRKALK